MGHEGERRGRSGSSIMNRRLLGIATMIIAMIYLNATADTSVSNGTSSAMTELSSKYLNTVPHGEFNSDHCNIALELLHRIGEECGDSKETDMPQPFTSYVQITDGRYNMIPSYNHKFRGYCGSDKYIYVNPLEAGPYDWGKIVQIDFKNEGKIWYNITSGSIPYLGGSYTGGWNCQGALGFDQNGVKIFNKICSAFRAEELYWFGSYPKR